MKTIILYALILSCICQGIMAGTINPDEPDIKYLQLAEEDLLDCVAPLVSKIDSSITSLSSCVIIKPRYALTAAHIFFLQKDRDNFYVRTGDEYVKVDKVVCHKFFEFEKRGFYDIAVIKLSKDIKLKKYPVFYTKKQEVNMKAIICGFGYTGTFDTGSTFSDAKKRAGFNKIDSIKHQTLVCSPSASKLEFLIAHGDSGGALFIDNKLAGINSYVYTTDGNPNSSWDDQSGHTRLVLFLDWIKENTK